MGLMINEYRYNSNFREYVDEYCDENNCSIEEAFNNIYVRQKFWMVTEL